MLVRYYTLARDNSLQQVSRETFYELESLSTSPSHRHVGLDHIGEYRVSTILLPWDSEFETMVFRGNNNADLYCSRYDTFAKAEAGHKDIVARLRAGTLWNNEG